MPRTKNTLLAVGVGCSRVVQAKKTICAMDQRWGNWLQFSGLQLILWWIKEIGNTRKVARRAGSTQVLKGTLRDVSRIWTALYRVRRHVWKMLGRTFAALCFDIFLTTVTQIWRLNENVTNLKNYWHYSGLESFSILASGFRFNSSHISQFLFRSMMPFQFLFFHTSLFPTAQLSTHLSSWI